MRITVFTPTYNRANMIENLYQSLQKQTFHDFEWIVIDDGSIDETKELLKSWKKEENSFSIRYVYSENKGKMKQINAAMDMAQGDMFFTVDSDDILTVDALEKIDSWEKEMPNNGEYCGLAGDSSCSAEKKKNPVLPGEFYDASLFQRYSDNGKEHIGYDRAWVFYTDVYRKYKFPEFDNEKFIAEAVVWNRMANDGLKIRCFNDIIYIFEQHEGGLTDTISNTLINSPKGYGLWKAELIRFLEYSYIQKIKEYYIFYCDLKEKHSWKQIADYIQASKLEMLIIHIVYTIKHGVKKC